MSPRAGKKVRRRETRHVSIMTLYVPDLQSVIDCMRYERLCPYEESDSSKLIALSNHDDVGTTGRVIRFCRYSAAGTDPSLDRFASFGVRVIDERSPDDVPLSEEAAVRVVEALAAGRMLRKAR